MIGLQSHVSLIKHDAIILFCCGSAERSATMLFMLHGTCKNRKDPCGNLLSHELQFPVTTMEFSGGGVKMIHLSQN